MSQLGRAPILSPPVDPIVGIDLGTTNTVVALAVESGDIQVLGDALSRRVLPSVVSFHPSGSVLVGEEAKERRLIDVRNTIYAAKRLIGQTLDGPGIAALIERLPFTISEGVRRQPIIRTRAGQFGPAEISAIVLNHVRGIAERNLGTDVQRAVVTVPANFTDAQRAATENAGTIAGVEIVRVLNEPTAAALAYGHARALDEIIAVYDFGGGTFDISIVRLGQDVYEVLGTAGHPMLGGEDIDVRLADVMVDVFLRQERVDLRNSRGAMQRLRSVAEQIKIQLSRRKRAVVKIDEIAYGANGRPLNLHFEITREQFNEYARAMIDCTFPVCQEAAQMAGLAPQQVQEVVLVGGTTRMPYVRERVAQFFGKTPRIDVNPDEAVAMGAALQAMALRHALGAAAPPTTLDMEHPAGPAGPAGRGDAGARPPTSRDIDGLDTGTDKIGQSESLGGLFDDLPDSSLSDSTDGAQSLSQELDIELEVSSSTHTLSQFHGTVTGSIDLSDTSDQSIELDLASLLEGPESGRQSYTGEMAALDTAAELHAAALDGAAATDAALGVNSASYEQDDFARLVTNPTSASDDDQMPFSDSDNLELDLALMAQLATGEATQSIALGGVDESPDELFSPAAAQSDQDMPTMSVLAPGATSSQGRPGARLSTDEVTDVGNSRGRAGAGEKTLTSASSPLSRVAPDQKLRTTQVPLMAMTRAHNPDSEALTLRRGNRARTGAGRVGSLSASVPAIIDVTPKGIGVSTVSGYCDLLISRNQRVPIAVTRTFATSKNGQDIVCIVVCQGESRRVADNVVLGNLLLRDLAPRPRGHTQIDVVFEIDESGILRVRARDSVTGKETRAQLDILGRAPDAQVQAAAQRLRKILQ